MQLDNPKEPSYNIETIAVTGTREGMTLEQRKAFRKLLASLAVTTFIHGDCIGADEQMHNIAMKLELDIKIRPANLPKYRAYCEGGEVIAKPEEPLSRNRKMVDQAKALIACPKDLKPELRSGTWSTVRYAQKTDCLYWIVYPDGSVTHLSL